MIKQKREMSALVWIIIVLVAIGLGIGLYFLLTGDSSPIANGGNSMPQPPALPSG